MPTTSLFPKTTGLTESQELVHSGHASADLWMAERQRFERSATTAKPLQEPLRHLMIFNITHSITIMSDGSVNFRNFQIEGTQPNLKTIDADVR
jgi:hypothetical protein